MSDQKPKSPEVRPLQKNIPSKPIVHPTAKSDPSPHTANVPKGQIVHPDPPKKPK